jgi:hypothetical protein
MIKTSKTFLKISVIANPLKSKLNRKAKANKIAKTEISKSTEKTAHFGAILFLIRHALSFFTRS